MTKSTLPYTLQKKKKGLFNKIFPQKLGRVPPIMHTIEEFDQTFKIVVLGDNGVGKRSLLRRLCESSSKEYWLASIDRSAMLCVDGLKIKLLIYATPQQLRNTRDILACQGFLIVYDLSVKHTFNNVKRWVIEVERYRNDCPPIILVGNKSDQSLQKAVSDGEVKELTELLNCPHVETSAKEDVNVHQAFTMLIRTMLDKLGLVPT